MIKQLTTRPFFLLLWFSLYVSAGLSIYCLIRCHCMRNGRRCWGCYRWFLLAGSRGWRWSEERIFIVLWQFRRLPPVVDVVGSRRWRDLLVSELVVAVIERIAIWSESIFFRLVVARGRAPGQVSTETLIYFYISSRPLPVSFLQHMQTIRCFSSLWGWDCQTCRRGLSRYFEGKSESFRSLSEVRFVEDLVKKETPSRKRLKASGDYGFDSTQKRCDKPRRFHGRTISKKTSSVFWQARRNRNGALLSSKMPSLLLHENLQWRCLRYHIRLDKRKFILVSDHFFLSLLLFFFLCHRSLNLSYT